MLSPPKAPDLPPLIGPIGVRDPGVFLLGVLAHKGVTLEAGLTKLSDRESEQLRHVSDADQQIESLALFENLMTRFADDPQRIKALIPKFVNFIVYNEDATGQGQLDVSLYGRLSPNLDDSGFWREAMEELGRLQTGRRRPRCGPGGAGSSEYNTGSPLTLSADRTDRYGSI